MANAEEPPAGAITHLWDCVRRARGDDGDPSPRQIHVTARDVLRRDLPVSTIETWFATWDKVPATWERFETLVLALGAEDERDWRRLYDAARAEGALRRRRAAARRSGGTAAAPPGPPASPATAPATPPVPLASPVRAGAGRRSGRGRTLVVALGAAVTAALAVGGYLAAATSRTSGARPGPGTAVAPPPGPAPGTPRTGCRQGRSYRVTEQGNLVNEAGRGFDEVRPGEVFVRYTCPGTREIDGRYYGTLPVRAVTGYVRVHKLEPAGPEG